MTETPKCPYCGAELEVTHAFVNNATAAHKLVYTCFCRACGVYTPKRSTPEKALSAALHRAEPEMRPLTLDEVKNHCKRPLEAEPLFMEFKRKENRCRWMLATAVKMLEAIQFTGDYGKSFRCWPRKPTPEQMQAEKWEE